MASRLTKELAPEYSEEELKEAQLQLKAEVRMDIAASGAKGTEEILRAIQSRAEVMSYAARKTTLVRRAEDKLFQDRGVWRKR